MPHSKGFSNRKDPRSSDAVSIGDVVDGLLSEPSLARGMPVAALARRWAEVVGERMAAETAPHTLDDGVLTVRATDGPWGAQARFLADEIRIKADDALGGGRVRRVRVIVVDEERNRW
jgi:predicted nucleic acid-binding Zn ribbon protein